jgi:predicted hydrolase (HD superfamily)
MSSGISLDQAMDLLHRHIKNPNMIKYHLASEAVP